MTGGDVYRGTAGALPRHVRLRRLLHRENFLLDSRRRAGLFDTPLGLASFGEDEAGEIYVVSSAARSRAWSRCAHLGPPAIHRAGG